MTRDAHDRDFNVHVVQDACAAANEADHQTSLTVLEKIGTIVEAKDSDQILLSA